MRCEQDQENQAGFGGWCDIFVLLLKEGHTYWDDQYIDRDLKGDGDHFDSSVHFEEAELLEV